MLCKGGGGGKSWALNNYAGDENKILMIRLKPSAVNYQGGRWGWVGGGLVQRSMTRLMGNNDVGLGSLFMI